MIHRFPLVVHSLLTCTLILTSSLLSAEEEPVFSGPQIGEQLPPFSAQGVFGDDADKDIEVVAKDAKDPTLLIFVHQRTRPAFGLTNTMMKYAKTRKGLRNTVVFLTEDTTAQAEWVRRVRKNLPEGITYAISSDGIEGPGSYGLNRNVALTLLVAQEGKVSANFALVQPGLQADGPKILKAIVEASGGGKVPTVEEIAGPRYTGQKPAARPPARSENDPKLVGLLRPVINKQATEDEVKEAAEKVEAYVKTNENARRELARITTTIVNSDKLENYGTEAARGYLKKWAKEFGRERPIGKRPANRTDRKDSDAKKPDAKKPDAKKPDAKKPDTKE